MVSSPPVEIAPDEDRGRGLLLLTSTGNSHIEETADGKHWLDPWALRRLASEAEQMADRLEGDQDGR